LAVALLLMAVAGPAWSDDLPAERQVPLRLAPNGLPAALEGFAPVSPDVRPIERGCGLLEAQHTDGRTAMILFDPGTEDEWGPVLLYVISDPDGRVLEWAGDGSRCGVEASGPRQLALPPRTRPA
jgi:hypothetical protein